MDRMKKKLGFGFMRLPMNGTEIDYEQTCRMVDTFLDRGFNYFDAIWTAGRKTPSAPVSPAAISGKNTC